MSKKKHSGLLSRLDSLGDTKLLVSTQLARCSSGSIPDFRFSDHFDFVKLFGQSPTSEVWLVKSKGSAQRYCVKKVVAKFNNNAERTRYIHEVEAVTFLPVHPNLVQYIRAWQEDQQFFCQMELCEGGSFGGCLRRLQPGCLVAERDIWVMAEQTAAGLAHCHLYGILHLDIKPDNIFLDRNGTYKIGDFGVAWVAGKGWELQEGDGAYVAPEVLAMHAQALPTAAADVFSFGATVYEAATGRPLPREMRRGLATFVREPPGGEGEGGGSGGEVSPTKGKLGGASSSLVELPEGRSVELAELISLCIRRDPMHRPTAVQVGERARAVLAARDAHGGW